MRLEAGDLPAITTFAGSTTSCLGGSAYLASENQVIFYVSIFGAAIGFLGLIYTVWNGERQYRLAQREMKTREAEVAAKLAALGLDDKERAA